ncbi:DUF3788 domain-containing protein [Acholeplasma sp. OttesenSCG-928-E16]|nr:DUF3788 domain-containing protein [Acholeplasma sp. OttesenSCG-928-E16]
MNERMLDKNNKPSFDEMLEYSGRSKEAWLQIEVFLKNNYNLSDKIRFPYGKDYGWGKSYRHNKKHICDIHAEKDSFTVFFQIRSEAINQIEGQLSEYALLTWKNRYPCGSGGWIRYRVTNKEQVNDIILFLSAKIRPLK